MKFVQAPTQRQKNASIKVLLVFTGQIPILNPQVILIKIKASYLSTPCPEESFSLPFSWLALKSKSVTLSISTS